MAVHMTNERVPDGAIRITEKEAIEMQMRNVTSWTPKKDMWAFRYGPYMLGAATTISGFLYNGHIRHKLRLRSFGAVASLIAAVVSPPTLTTVIHAELITPKIAINKWPCSVCAELRAILVQNLCATVYPFLISLVGNYAIANISGMYAIPPMKNMRELTNLTWRITKPLIPATLVLCGLNTALTVIIYSSQIKSIHKMTTIMSIMEEERDSLENTS